MNEEFSAGVKILLQRMETHPEEFYIEMPPNRVADNPKWGHLVTQIVSLKHGGDIRGEAIFLTEAEKDALYERYSKLRRKAFDDYVMREVLAPNEELSSSTNSTPTNPAEGALRYNIKTGTEEYYHAGTWFPVTTKAVISAGGGGGGGYVSSGYVGGGGGGGGGSVVVKTPQGTHTFTKSGTFTGTGNEYNNP